MQSTNHLPGTQPLIHDSSQKVVLITGATSGIGLATAQGLASTGSELILAGRSETRARQAITQIRQSHPDSKLGFVLADLSSPEDIRRMAEEISQRYSRLDVLINNAGAHFFKRQVNSNQIEMTFAVNHLAPFVLTGLLMPLMLKTAQQVGEARVINVSSNGHYGGKIDFSDLMFERRPYFFGWPAYQQSKLANVIFSAELDRRYRSRQLRSFSLHPGLVPTNIFRLNDGFLAKITRSIVRRYGVSEQEGAATTIYLAGSPDIGRDGGKYFEKNQPIQPSSLADDLKIAQELWRISEELTLNYS